MDYILIFWPKWLGLGGGGGGGVKIISKNKINSFATFAKNLKFLDVLQGKQNYDFYSFCPRKWSFQQWRSCSTKF